MNRKDYIERLVKLATLKWHLNETDIEELRLVLEMMPDRPILDIPSPTLIETEQGKVVDMRPPVVVMYGVGMPQQWYDGTKFTTTSTTTDDNDTKRD